MSLVQQISPAFSIPNLIDGIDNVSSGAGSSASRSSSTSTSSSSSDSSSGNSLSTTTSVTGAGTAIATAANNSDTSSSSSTSTDTTGTNGNAITPIVNIITVTSVNKPTPDLIDGKVIHPSEAHSVLKGSLLNDEIDGGAGDDKIRGISGNDWIYGKVGDDFAIGGEGNDHVLGGAGDDVLWGSGGDDVLSGGNGDDLLWGGAGINILTAGKGTDVFVLSNQVTDIAQTDIITDFSTDQGDSIKLKGNLSFQQLLLETIDIDSNGVVDTTVIKLQKDGKILGLALNTVDASGSTLLTSNSFSHKKTTSPQFSGLNTDTFEIFNALNIPCGLRKSCLLKT